MPLLPVCLIEPLWVEFSAQLATDERPEFDPKHPWGCHRRRVSDRVVFEHILAAMSRRLLPSTSMAWTPPSISAYTASPALLMEVRSPIVVQKTVVPSHTTPSGWGPVSVMMT
ncbi:hypothetical protein D092_24200 [Rhodococcus ruber Chol-4]|nr:hypothetical protein N505_0129050 [Rhodococcus aetherivorans]KXF83711.1 hypothetical protein D092_24200 [Rhodococcus ruber Chol-4]RQM32027.1 hypothetical protein TN91_22885 [Rhodococcus ruber]